MNVLNSGVSVASIPFSYMAIAPRTALLAASTAVMLRSLLYLPETFKANVLNNLISATTYGLSSGEEQHIRNVFNETIQSYNENQDLKRLIDPIFQIAPSFSFANRALNCATSKKFVHVIQPTLAIAAPIGLKTLLSHVIELPKHPLLLLPINLIKALASHLFAHSTAAVLGYQAGDIALRCYTRLAPETTALKKVGGLLKATSHTLSLALVLASYNTAQQRLATSPILFTGAVIAGICPRIILSRAAEPVLQTLPCTIACSGIVIGYANSLSFIGLQSIGQGLGAGYLLADLGCRLLSKPKNELGPHFRSYKD